MSTQPPLQRIARKLGRDLSAIEWTTPSHVYNPLDYAWSGQRTYLQRYGQVPGRVLLLGMNPGPWGMAQTGVPFGTISAVRNWFGIDTKLGRLLPEQHPRYPILGMQCHRDEGSGQRLWGWAEQRFGTPDVFFRHFFIWNYCPLLFLAQNRNLTPNHLSAGESRALDQVCNTALADALAALRPSVLVGIGRYAEQRLREVAPAGTPVRYLLHPSPANPRARHWTEVVEQTLEPWLPDRSRE